MNDSPFATRTEDELIQLLADHPGCAHGQKPDDLGGPPIENLLERIIRKGWVRAIEFLLLDPEGPKAGDAFDLDQALMGATLCLLGSRSSKPGKAEVAERVPKMIDLLISAGASPNATSHRGTPAISYAADFGCVESVKVLISRGASPNGIDSRSTSPLDHAISQQNAELGKLLIGADADLSLAKKRPDARMILASWESELLKERAPRRKAGASVGSRQPGNYPDDEVMGL